MANSRANKSAFEPIQIGNTTYEIIDRLSLPNRGRWKVRDERPPPKGTLFTVIDLPISEASLQFKSTLETIKNEVNGIPRLADFEQRNGRLLLVVSWCHGMDLETYLKKVRNGKYNELGVWEAIRRMRSLSHLLGVLHRHCRIVHGDIKPANLILPQPGSIALIDFGSSWQIEKTRGRQNGDGADQHYSAPEVYEESTIVDERADQFSTSVVLYQMLTGELPFSNLGGIAGNTRYREQFANYVVDPSAKNSSLKDIPNSIRLEIVSLLSRGLNFDPEMRFPTSRAFSDAFDSIWVQLVSAKTEKPTVAKPWWERFLG